MRLVSPARAVHNQGLYLLVSTAISNRCTLLIYFKLRAAVWHGLSPTCIPVGLLGTLDEGDRTGDLSITVLWNHASSCGDGAGSRAGSGSRPRTAYDRICRCCYARTFASPSPVRLGCRWTLEGIDEARIPIMANSTFVQRGELGQRGSLPPHLLCHLWMLPNPLRRDRFSPQDAQSHKYSMHEAL